MHAKSWAGLFLLALTVGAAGIVKSNELCSEFFNDTVSAYSCMGHRASAHQRLRGR
jgi:hypothetical protein